jgi:capsular polysaccharide biosynthesis protein
MKNIVIGMMIALIIGVGIVYTQPGKVENGIVQTNAVKDPGGGGIGG